MYFLWEFLVDLWEGFTIGIHDRIRWRRKERRRIEGYLNATADDVKGMSDIEAFAPIYYRLKRKFEKERNPTLLSLMSLNASQRVFWVVNAYEQENDGGGIIGFISSKYSYIAPIVLDALKAIGADEHARLFCDFVEKNGIDTAALSELEIHKVKGKRKKKTAVVELEEKYSAKEFDEKYLALDPIEKYLAVFVRENADELIK